jgi:hypothetical protein
MKPAVATFLLCVAACGLALAASAPTTQQQQEQPPQQSRRSSSSSRERYSDRYSILTQRNIFLKDRSRGSSRNGSSGGGGSTTQSSTQPTHRSPEETLILRGIVMEQGEVRAYFEDIANSRMVRVAMGEPIARGRITSIGLDAVEYETAGSSSTGTTGSGGGGARGTFVAIGNDLTGKVSEYDMPSSSAAAAAAAMATTSPVMPTGIEGLNPNDPNLTPEQRMKLRRMQELKK